VLRFLTPRWLGLHALLVASVLAFYRLGLWQWHKAHRPSGGWLNWGYAFQWWLFVGFAVFLYAKLVLDELDPAAAEGSPEAAELPPVVQRRAAAPHDDEDDELAAYNRYLRSLHEAQQ
jgi:DNA-binding transcriptional regulator of glucitol operon